MPKLVILIFFIIAGLPALSQKKNKASKIAFCGVTANDKEFIRKNFQPQFDFLQLKENDTLVDIGAGSGWYEGALSTITPFTNLTFYLVDIDENCLNATKVNNVISHYSKVKGAPITNHFTVINNTTDSLWLPTHTFKKICILNTLHEIPDLHKIVWDMNNILQPGGEVIVLEMIPRKQNELHGGCHKPLLTFEQLNTLFSNNGFTSKDRIELQQYTRSPIQMIRYVKN
jgi:ubiquinone/menaquinone biosynthesis C-methylase UbiE